MIYLCLYLAVTWLYFYFFCKHEYRVNGFGEDYKFLTLGDVLLGLFLTQVPVINLFFIWVFTKDALEGGYLREFFEIKVWKERI